MAEHIPANGLSPLDQIRFSEAEITRKIAASREISAQSITNVKVQAALLKKQARDSGNRKGQIRYKEIVSKAEEEARTIVDHAQVWAAELRQRGQSRMDGAIQDVINTVVDLTGNEE